ncbi:hypothetical protein CUMW_168010, partial [Citrus unshiu]
KANLSLSSIETLKLDRFTVREDRFRASAEVNFLSATLAVGETIKCTARRQSFSFHNILAAAENL